MSLCLLLVFLSCPVKSNTLFVCWHKDRGRSLTAKGKWLKTRRDYWFLWCCFFSWAFFILLRVSGLGLVFVTFFRLQTSRTKSHRLMMSLTWVCCCCLGEISKISVGWADCVMSCSVEPGPCRKFWKSVAPIWHFYGSLDTAWWRCPKSRKSWWIVRMAQSPNLLPFGNFENLWEMVRLRIIHN